MAAREGCRGTLAGIVGVFNQPVEKSVTPSRTYHAFLRMSEIVADVGEDALCDAVFAHGKIVILGAGDGQEDEDDIVYHERCEGDEGHAGELLRPIEKVEQRHRHNHRKVAGIAQVHEFAEDRT